MCAMINSFNGAPSGSDHSSVLASLIAGMDFNTDLPCDIYVCFGGSPLHELSGFLVSKRNDPDDVVAYCPMPPRMRWGQAGWRCELMRQFEIALRIARCPAEEERGVDAIWLGENRQCNERAMPAWIYALSCIPLTQPDWDGNFIHPRPFCPSLFQHMSQQTGALEWLKKRQSCFAARRGIN
jgi:hypothetical protein